METTQIITLLGISLSSIVGAAGLWIGIKNSKKTIFINSITAARIKYIHDLRNSIAEFCVLLNNYKYHEGDLEKSVTTEKLYEIRKEFRIKYIIQLQLNPMDADLDKKILDLMDEIILLYKKDPEKKINELITITQFLLKLEWEGAKRESRKGILSENEKLDLNKKYFRLYEKHLILNSTI